MKPKERKPSQNIPQQTRAEKKATMAFNADLQKAVDGVDWANVKLPRQSC